MSEKICPIRGLAATLSHAICKVDWADGECLKEQCALWSDDNKCCGLIAQSLTIHDNGKTTLLNLDGTLR